MGFATFRVSQIQSYDRNTKRSMSPSSSCFTGGFFKAPTNGASVDSLKPLDIEWDNTCLDTENVDIYVLAPGSHSITPHIWNNIPFSTAKYTLQLQPRWWNDTSSLSLQLAIIPANSQLALGTNTLPAGPVITATYSPPADGKIPDIANTSAMSKGKSLSPGKAAAAVLLPLLFVICVAAFCLLRHQRKATSSKTRRFSQAIDKRMSTISSDWKSVSAAGAAAAIRNSVAAGSLGGGRPESSAFAFGNIRPASGVPDDYGDAYPLGEKSAGPGVGPRRPLVATSFAAERASRVSRVSFATTEHPRTSRTSTAFADGHSNGRHSVESGGASLTSSRRPGRFQSQGGMPVPPVPSMLRATVASSVYPDSVQYPDLEPDQYKATSPTMSPRQAQGPLTLTPEDILSRMNGGSSSRSHFDPDPDREEEMNEVMPALSMMRTGLEPHTPASPSLSTSHPFANSASNVRDDYLLAPAPPAPVHSKATSSPFAESPLSTMMSPDDMLRAYAERQRSPPPVSSPPPSFRGLAFGGEGGPLSGAKRKLSFRLLE